MGKAERMSGQTIEDPTPLRDRLRERIAAMNTTPRAVSLAAGLSPAAVRMILSGHSRAPKAETLTAIAQVLDCDLSYLLGVTQAPRAIAARESEVAELALLEDHLRLLVLRDRVSLSLAEAIRYKLKQAAVEGVSIPESVADRAKLARLMGVIDAETEKRSVALWQLVSHALDSRDPEYLSRDEAQPLLHLVTIGRQVEEPEDADARLDFRAELTAELDFWASALAVSLRAPNRRLRNPLIQELADRTVSAFSDDASSARETDNSQS